MQCGGGKRRFVPGCSVIVFCAILVCGAGTVTTADEVAEQADKFPAKEEEKSSGDIEKRIDTTIKLLQIIKEEMNESDEDADTGTASAVPAAISAPVATTAADVKLLTPEDKDEWVKKLRSSMRKAKRVLKKVKKAIKEEENSGVLPDEDIKEHKGASEKLSKAIEAMKIVKEELDRQ